jgi:glycosyltransferase involved in cell wall biosynthesis
MNILFLQSSNIIGGAEISILEQVRYLSCKGINCFVALTYSKKNILGKLFEKERSVKVFYFMAIHSIPSYNVESKNNLFNNLYKFYKYGPEFISIYKLKKIIKKYHIDIIHSNTVYPKLGNIVAKKMKIKHVQHLREVVGGDEGITKFKYLSNPDKFKSIYGTHDGLIANSYYCMKSNEPWYTSKQKMIMPNSVDSDFFNLPIEKTRKIAGMVANVTSKIKRHDLFIKLASIYSSKYGNDVSFLIYGNLPDKFDKYFMSLKNKINSNNLDKTISFVGIVPSKLIYSQIKVLIHTYSYESFGRIFIEAAASGVPVLAIKGGGASEIVTKKMGFLFSENELEKMADTLHNLINSESERLIISKSARIEAKIYIPKEAYKNLIPFYKKVINKNN